MRKAVYAGSFDPVTNGHLWMIKEGAKLFDELVVAIGINPDKKYTFSLDERLEMLKKSTRTFPNVEIASFENQYLVKYADSISAKYMLRGIRSEGDFDYEKAMRNINADWNPEISTIFLMPSREIAEVSSSLVRGLVGPERWEEIVERYVSRSVYNKILVKNKGLQKRWDELWKRIGGDEQVGKQAYHDLLQLYGESSRAYHNFVHIAHVLREFDSARSSIQDPDMVEVTLWYHDAIYQTQPGSESERKSADLALQRLGQAGVSQCFLDDVACAILETSHKSSSPHLQTSDEKYFLDIDLSILGKPEPEFDEYELDIREEYSWVPEQVFKEKRKEILTDFLQRGNIYSTEFFREKYEEKARKNLERSIGRL